MRRVLVLLVAALLVVAACGGGDQARTESPTPSAATGQNFGIRGPHAVGATRLQIDAPRPVEVFYPAERATLPANAAPYRYTPEETFGPLLASLPPGVAQTMEITDTWFDVPSSTGPFPLVVFSHGMGMMRFSYTFHAAHLASWGYVVAVPEVPTHDLAARLSGTQSGASDVPTLLDTVALLEAESGRPGSVLNGLVTGEQVAIEGHSAGGRDAALAAYDDKVDTWIGDAPTAPVPDAAAGGRNIVTDARSGFDPAAGEFDLGAYLASATPPDKPSMMVVADKDVYLPLRDGRAVYDWLPAPKRYVVLADTGHHSFVNECQYNRSGETAAGFGFDPSSNERSLVENGCLPSFAPVEDVWATWDHLTVAQLNLVFGINTDTATASLQRSYLDATFPGRIADYAAEQ